MTAIAAPTTSDSQSAPPQETADASPSPVVEIANLTSGHGDVDSFYVNLDDEVMDRLDRLLELKTREVEALEQIVGSQHVLVELANQLPAELERRGIGLGGDCPGNEDVVNAIDRIGDLLARRAVRRSSPKGPAKAKPVRATPADELRARVGSAPP